MDQDYLARGQGRVLDFRFKYRGQKRKRDGPRDRIKDPAFLSVSEGAWCNLQDFGRPFATFSQSRSTGSRVQAQHDPRSLCVGRWEILDHRCDLFRKQGLELAFGTQAELAQRVERFGRLEDQVLRSRAAASDKRREPFSELGSDVLSTFVAKIMHNSCTYGTTLACRLSRCHPPSPGRAERDSNSPPETTPGGESSGSGDSRLGRYLRLYLLASFCRCTGGVAPDPRLDFDRQPCPSSPLGRRRRLRVELQRVEPTGIEPVTSCLQSRRSAS